VLNLKRRESNKKEGEQQKLGKKRHEDLSIRTSPPRKKKNQHPTERPVNISSLDNISVNRERKGDPCPTLKKKTQEAKLLKAHFGRCHAKLGKARWMGDRGAGDGIGGAEARLIQRIERLK